ncbi:uncharacterized protein DUF998 [Streptomyces sp. SLBN-118]|uniref:DUF998 domain-containing protein n=1 Tax=Streptomyces sp. SLBN-118 TaxID=2768454 RepID=UPI001152B070|nr:DUF998 domain-containing protein [Streptomyces sp. SLBN-118]TQK44264.1 uncharacterized protein DUF998 [Streptomyces sp. SLBN-118]
MRPVSWWALLSSGSAPLLLVGGWLVAALLRGRGYEPVTQTISVLAADGVPGYWVMKGALGALGICHLLTACGLRPAALAGRVALGAGGVSAIVLALLPVPRSGGSLEHGAVVAVGFALLALWPVLAADRSGVAPWGLRPAVSIVVSALMWVGAAWFLIELHGHGAAGIAERVLTSAQSLWPFLVVASCLRPIRS